MLLEVIIDPQSCLRTWPAWRVIHFKQGNPRPDPCNKCPVLGKEELAITVL